MNIAFQYKKLVCSTNKNMWSINSQKKGKFISNKNRYFGSVFSHNASDRLYYTFITIFNKPFHLRDEKQKEIASQIFDTLQTDVRNGKNDKDIYDALHTQMNTLFYSNTPPVIFTSGRADSRVSDIERICEAVPNKPTATAIINYLDFGCGESSITSAVGKAVGAKHVVGMDVHVPSKAVDFEFKLLEHDVPHIPLETESFELITAFMVLHHLRNPEATLAEMNRVLKPGGLLIIREHDIDASSDSDGRTFLDMLHGFYEVVWAKTGHQENPNHIDTYFAHYRNRTMWTKLITAAGFERIETPDINALYNQADIPRNYAFGKKIINPFYFYYAVYRKPQK
jgi:SAM-dependent methyltransferase